MPLFIPSLLPFAENELNPNLESDGEQKNLDHHRASAANHVWSLDAEIHNDASQDNRQKENPGLPPGRRAVQHMVARRYRSPNLSMLGKASAAIPLASARREVCERCGNEACRREVKQCQLRIHG